MKKLTLLTTAMTIALSSLSFSSSNAAGWQKEVHCERSTVDSAVNISSDVVSKSKNVKTACYGSDNPLCDLRIYNITVEAYINDPTGAVGYGEAWGPSNHRGNLKGIIQNLPYFKSTGVNAIWLSPIFYTEAIDGQAPEATKNDGTGTYASNFFTIDPRLGTMKDLQELVEKAHKQGLYVFLTASLGRVKNNIELSSPKGNRMMVTSNCRDIKGYVDKVNTFGNPSTCVNAERSIDFLKDFMEFWVDKVKIDGWNFDAAYQFETKVWSELKDVLKQASEKKTNSYKFGTAGKDGQPLGFMFAHIQTTNPKDIENNAFANHAFDASLNYPMREILVQVLASNGNTFSKSSCGQAAKKLNDEAMNKMQGYSKKGLLVNMVNSQTVVRFGDLLQRVGYEKDANKISETYRAAHMAAYSFAVANSGPVAFYYGDEIQMELPNFVESPSRCDQVNQCDDHVGRLQAKTSDLSVIELAMKKDFANLMKYRVEHPALAHGTRQHIYSDESLYIDYKEYKTDRVIYVLNTSSKPRKISFDDNTWAKLGFTNCSILNMKDYKKVGKSNLIAPAISGSFFQLDCTESR